LADYITVTVASGWSESDTASRAWNGLASFGRMLADIFIWLGILSPIWIINWPVLVLLKQGYEPVQIDW
jgi:hypothetical protein